MPCVYRFKPFLSFFLKSYFALQTSIALGDISPSTNYQLIRHDIQTAFSRLIQDLEKRGAEDHDKMVAYMPLVIGFQLTLEAEKALKTKVNLDSNKCKALESKASLFAFAAIENQIVDSLNSKKKSVVEAHKSLIKAHLTLERAIVDFRGVDIYLKNIHTQYQEYFDQIQSPFTTYFSP